MNTTDSERTVFAVDIGSTLVSKKTKTVAFAWARRSMFPPGPMCSSQEPDLLVERVAEDLNRNCSVALGFEAPLYIPIPRLSSDLSRARPGEGSRAWSAPAGLSVASLCLHQASWILREVRTRVKQCAITLDVAQWPPKPGPQATLFLWEAFVSRTAHSNDHRRDAATAADYFASHERNLQPQHALGENEQLLSLIAVAALWSKWTSNADDLETPTLVLCPQKPFVGDIGAL